MLNSARFLSIATLLAAVLVLDAGQGPGKEDALPEGAVARLGTLRWRHGGVVTHAIFLPDGKSLISAGYDKTIRVWEFPSGKELRRFGPKTGGEVSPPQVGLQPIGWGAGPGQMAFAVSKDGKTAAGCFGESQILRWEVSTGKELPVLKSPKFVQHATALAFSPDGSQLASMERDNTIRIWDLKTNNEQIAFNAPNPGTTVFSGGLTPVLAYAQDGKSVLTMRLEIENNMTNYAIKFFDPATGKEKSAITAPPRTGFNAVAVAPDGKTLVASGFDGAMVHFDIATSKELRKLPGEQRTTVSLALTHDGKKLYSRSMSTGVIREWDLAEAKELRQISSDPPKQLMGRAAAGQVQVSVSPDGKTLALAGDGHVIQFIDLTTGKAMTATGGHRDTVIAVGYTADGKEVVTRGNDNQVRRWDAATGKEIGEAKSLPLPSPTYAVAVSPAGDLMLVQRNPNQGLLLLDVASGKEVGNVASPKNDFMPGMLFAPNAKVLAVRWQQGQKIELYDVPSLKVRCSIPVKLGGGGNPGGPIGGGPAAPATMILSADGQTLAAFPESGVMGLFDTATSKKLTAINMTEAPLGGAFSPDGRTLALDMGDGTVSVWELASARERRRFGQKRPQPEQPGMGQFGTIYRGGATHNTSVAFSPSGRLLALGGKDGKIQIWDAATGRSIAELAGHAGPVECLAFAPDGNMLASGGADTTGLLWDMKRLQPKAVLAAKKLTAPELQTAWAALAAGDSGKAMAGICDLAADPNQVVPFIKTNVKTPPALDAKQVEKLIADLDSAEYKVRQSANAELAKLGAQVVPYLTRALAAKPALEVEKRLEALRDQLTSTVLTGDALQGVRAIEVLELIGTPEARQVLQTFADGPEGTVTRNAARAALARAKH
jgi:WD40 repeat protein